MMPIRFFCFETCGYWHVMKTEHTCANETCQCIHQPAVNRNRWMEPNALNKRQCHLVVFPDGEQMLKCPVVTLLVRCQECPLGLPLTCSDILFIIHTRLEQLELQALYAVLTQTKWCQCQHFRTMWVVLNFYTVCICYSSKLVHVAQYLSSFGGVTSSEYAQLFFWIFCWSVGAPGRCTAWYQRCLHLLMTPTRPASTSELSSFFLENLDVDGLRKTCQFTRFVEESYWFTAVCTRRFVCRVWCVLCNVSGPRCTHCTIMLCR